MRSLNLPWTFPVFLQVTDSKNSDAAGQSRVQRKHRCAADVAVRRPQKVLCRQLPLRSCYFELAGRRPP